MTEALCPRCARPIHDTAYIDQACRRDLTRALADVLNVVGDITLTVAKLSNAMRSGSVQIELGDDGWHKGAGALYPHPLPIDLHAAARHDAAVNTLNTWGRHIAEERGGMPRRWIASARGVLGPVHPLRAAALWLTANLDWLAHRPEAEEAYDDIEQACRAVVDVVDRHEPGELVGLCPCETFLYARAGAESTKCRRCGMSWDVAASREQMHRDLRDRPVTASEAARLAVYLDVIPDTGRLRKLLWDWCDRGHIHAVAEDSRYKGPPRYLLGQVLDRLMHTVAAKAA